MSRLTHQLQQRLSSLYVRRDQQKSTELFIDGTFHFHQLKTFNVYVLYTSLMHLFCFARIPRNGRALAFVFTFQALAPVDC